jgi:hypothetical protein
VETSLEPQDTESISQSIIPYPYDDNRAKYLGLRASGFTPKEAVKLIGLTGAALSAWRKDAEFTVLEKRLPEFRKQLALEYATLEFYRTFRLITTKDADVIKRDLDGEELSEEDHKYLLKMRSFYTPQQMQVLAAMATGESGDNFNFTDLVKDMGRQKNLKVTARRETVEVSSGEETKNYIEG